jgi:flagellar biosynthesis/type III secretory pathway chaperone
MNTQQVVEQLFAQLSELVQQLKQLAAVLQQEQTALTQNDFAALETLAHDKEVLSAQIEQIEQRRHTLCSQLKIDCDFAGIESYLATISGKLLPRLEQLWDQINTLGSQCASQNQVNGILLAHQQRHAQQALAILRGVSGSEELYSASGSQQSSDYQHSLGRV